VEFNLAPLSKFFSLVLRHQPEKFGLTLDQHGWAEVAKVLEAANQYGRSLDHDTLLRIVHENDKQRFTLSPDGRFIRANQGHSVAVDLQLQSVAPPDTLYHGTVAKFVKSIREQGLIPGSRNHVHLSADVATAKLVGQRRGKPVVLTIDTKTMHENDCNFYQSLNGVWLTSHVPPEHITFPTGEATEKSDL